MCGLHKHNVLHPECPEKKTSPCTFRKGLMLPKVGCCPANVHCALFSKPRSPQPVQWCRSHHMSLDLVQPNVGCLMNVHCSMTAVLLQYTHRVLSVRRPVPTGITLQCYTRSLCPKSLASDYRILCALISPLSATSVGTRLRRSDDSAAHEDYSVVPLQLFPPNSVASSQGRVKRKT